jgi:hypothetical protein
VQITDSYLCTYFFGFDKTFCENMQLKPLKVCLLIELVH